VVGCEWGGGGGHAAGISRGSYAKTLQPLPYISCSYHQFLTTNPPCRWRVYPGPWRSCDAFCAPGARPASWTSTTPPPPIRWSTRCRGGPCRTWWSLRRARTGWRTSTATCAPLSRPSPRVSHPSQGPRRDTICSRSSTEAFSLPIGQNSRDEGRVPPPPSTGELNLDPQACELCHSCNKCSNVPSALCSLVRKGAR